MDSGDFTMPLAYGRLFAQQGFQNDNSHGQSYHQPAEMTNDSPFLNPMSFQQYGTSHIHSQGFEFPVNGFLETGNNEVEDSEAIHTLSARYSSSQLGPSHYQHQFVHDQTSERSNPALLSNYGLPATNFSEAYNENYNGLPTPSPYALSSPQSSSSWSQPHSYSQEPGYLSGPGSYYSTPNVAHSMTTNKFGSERAESSDQLKSESASDSIPYAHLIYEALAEAPDHKLVLRDIYAWFEANTDKHRNKGWKNSVRHNLSMNEAFAKVRCQWSTDELKSGYIWQLKPAALAEGIHPTTRYRKKVDAKRVQKRRRGAYKTAPTTSSQPQQAMDQYPSGYSNTAFGAKHGSQFAQMFPSPSSDFLAGSPPGPQYLQQMGY